MVKKPVLAVTPLDAAIETLARQTGRKILGSWAADCAERVLPYFEASYPADPRPRQAVAALREWVRTGIFHMAEVRSKSLAAHAAARDAARDDPARAAARSAGQALAAAHVPAHSIAAARYAVSAVRDAALPADAAAAALLEREWQLRHLSGLRSGENRKMGTR
ncbi:MAG: putative immunity protein [Anaerolineae bacterium]